MLRRRRRRGHTIATMTIPESTRRSLTQRLNYRRLERWPALSALEITFRANFVYVKGVNRDGALPLFRLQYVASASRWGFALYLASSESYERAVLPTGLLAGTPEDALDCACLLYVEDDGPRGDHDREVCTSTPVWHDPVGAPVQDSDPRSRICPRRHDQRPLRGRVEQLAPSRMGAVASWQWCTTATGHSLRSATAPMAAVVAAATTRRLSGWVTSTVNKGASAPRHLVVLR